MREPGVGRSNLHMDQLTFYSSDSHPRLHIRTTPCLSSFKKTQTQTRNQTNYIRISKDGAQVSALPQAPQLIALGSQVESHCSFLSHILNLFL